VVVVVVVVPFCLSWEVDTLVASYQLKEVACNEDDDIHDEVVDDDDDDDNHPEMEASDEGVTWHSDVEETWHSDVEETWHSDVEETWHSDVEETWHSDVEETIHIGVVVYATMVGTMVDVHVVYVYDGFCILVEACNDCLPLSVFFDAFYIDSFAADASAGCLL
jgi:hypothetical protein